MRPDENALELGNSRDDDELRDTSREVTARLTSLGVWLSGTESPEALVQMVEAIERFEEAVRAKGGDLMVDEPPKGRSPQPDQPEFALPIRRADERPSEYIQRIIAAADVVWQRQPL